MNKVLALESLRPKAKWIVADDEIIWDDQEQTKPTDEEVAAEIERLQSEHDSKAYARSRAEEYPPITDYIDGVVKGDQAQIDAYIAACQAVKAKYPKPE